MPAFPSLDLDFVRSQFPAFELPEFANRSFFENAGGSLPCRQTVDALHNFYLHRKVQPFGGYEPSDTGGSQMDHSRVRWAEALGVSTDDVSFGPSTSANTYVLAAAYAQILAPGDEVVVTNQDHEANTGAIRRAAERAGAVLREWRTDPHTGLLDVAGLEGLLTDKTRVVTFPHCSNIVGQENDVAALTAAAHSAGARVIVDGVSFAPHGFADIGQLAPDVYLFSLYKTYSVHQGLMVTQNGILDELPNQGHWFNEGIAARRLTPAGPDHAQEAAAGAVLDYVEATARHHRVDGSSLRDATAAVSSMWQAHEEALLVPVLDLLSSKANVRLLGPATVDAATGHRCPTVAFSPLDREPAEVAAHLVDSGIMCSAGAFYADRVLDGLDIDPQRGVVRVSWVHYTSPADIDRLTAALASALA